MPAIGEALVKVWAAAILNFLTKPLAPITPAIKIPMITIAAETSIRVKAEDDFLIIEQNTHFFDKTEKTCW